MSPPFKFNFFPVNPRLPSALSMKYVRTLITLVLYLARLAAGIRRADVLHIFTPGYLSFYLAPVPALLLARFFGKQTILNYHDGRAGDHLAHWPMARRLMRLATAIVVPSDYLVEVFARFGFHADRIHNIAETGSVSYRRARRGPGPCFFTIAASAAEYNPACTLRAFAIIQERYPEARLVIAHDGPLRPKLEALAAMRWACGNTQFIGSVSPREMAALYDTADIYLMSPNADNMPLSLLECFAAGLPVVSSKAGGIPEYRPRSDERPAVRAQRSSGHGRLRAALARRARPCIPPGGKRPSRMRQIRVAGNWAAMDRAVSSAAGRFDQFGVDLFHAPCRPRNRKRFGGAARSGSQLLAQYARFRPAFRERGTADRRCPLQTTSRSRRGESVRDFRRPAKPPDNSRRPSLRAANWTSASDRDGNTKMSIAAHAIRRPAR